MLLLINAVLTTEDRPAIQKALQFRLNSAGLNQQTRIRGSGFAKPELVRFRQEFAIKSADRQQGKRKLDKPNMRASHDYVCLVS